jgi:hypothetical protein
LVVGGREKGGLEHVATHQGVTPEIAQAIKEEQAKLGQTERKEDIRHA